MEITAKQSQSSDRTATVNYDFGTNLDDASEKFGADMIFKGFVKQAVISLQANMRRWMEAGKSDTDIEQLVAAWKPGMVERATPKDTTEKLLAKFSSMSAEEKAALIQSLQAMLQ